jgi:hypothetical protein
MAPIPHTIPQTQTQRPTSPTQWTIRPATGTDVRFIVPRFSAASINELAALTGIHAKPGDDLAQVITILLNNLAQKWVIVSESDDVPVALFDIGPVAEGSVLWCALSGSFTEHGVSRQFNNLLSATLDHVSNLYPVLLSFVDARNHAHAAWLQKIGFRHMDEKIIGERGYPFFVLIREVAEPDGLNVFH